MRPIDADAYETDVRKRYCKHCDNGKGLRCRVCWINDMLGEIENAHTIEAKPVVHAHWKRKNNETKCSNCGETALGTCFEEEFMSNYCPYCGAQMDEVVK